MAEMKQVFEKTESKMKKSIGHLQEEYAAIRAGRANPAVLDKIMVNYYDTPTPHQPAGGGVRVRGPGAAHPALGYVGAPGH